jgi:hypothetical protein
MGEEVEADALDEKGRERRERGVKRGRDVGAMKE